MVCSLPSHSLHDVTIKNIAYKDEKIPTFNQSVYNRDYAFKGFSSAEGVKRKETLFTGGKFQGQSTYEYNFRNK